MAIIAVKLQMYGVKLSRLSKQAELALLIHCKVRLNSYVQGKSCKKSDTFYFSQCFDHSRNF